MQFHQGKLKFVFAFTKHKSFLVAFVGLLNMILSACGNQSASPIQQIAEQPTSTPQVIMLFTLPADELGVVVDAENQVLAVVPGSAAEKTGVQVGDFLESLDGVSFKEKEKVKEKIWEPKEGKKFKLKLKRNNKEEVLDISPSPPVFHANAPTPTPVPQSQDYF